MAVVRRDGGGGGGSVAALHAVFALTWHANACTGVLPEHVAQAEQSAMPVVDHVEPRTQRSGGGGGGGGGLGAGGPHTVLT